MTVSADNLDHVFEASSQGSYKCGPAQNVQLNNVTLAVSDFQYRAFGNTDKDDFPDSGRFCLSEFTRKDVFEAYIKMYAHSHPSAKQSDKDCCSKRR